MTQLNSQSTNLPIIDIANQIDSQFSSACILPQGGSTSLTLWCLSTYCLDAFQIFPRLLVYSPERRCGKSSCLELVDAFSNDSRTVSNATPAAIFRLIDSVRPTLILDEADTFVQNASEEMRGILNSGHKKSTASILRCNGKDHEPKQFSTWAPMALGSIGELQSTLMDRSICIPLKRKLSNEQVTKVSIDIRSQSSQFRSDIFNWANGQLTNLMCSQVEPPTIANDRAMDNWSPLFKVAENIGGNWPTKCLHAFNNLTVPAESGLSTQLLTDIREIFDVQATQNLPDKILAEEIVRRLNNDPEKPWATCNFSHTNAFSHLTIPN